MEVLALQVRQQILPLIVHHALNVPYVKMCYEDNWILKKIMDLYAHFVTILLNLLGQLIPIISRLILRLIMHIKTSMKWNLKSFKINLQE